jgi:tungstate transport system substrate-binding protein
VRAGPLAPLLGILIAFGGCGGDGENVIVLGATTSAQDSGILNAIISAFEDRADYEVRPIVAGSGQILELARRGEVDITLTHSPEDEERLLAEGHTAERRPIFENFFVVVGPPGDSAGAGFTVTIEEAFRAIAEAGAPFVSRGDGSGTHRREMAIWAAAGIDPLGRPWYQESAVGQGQNLLVASEKRAYSLVDFATFLVFRERLDLIAFVAGREQPNVYSVMLVNPERHRQVNAGPAREFYDFLVSDRVRAIVTTFGEDRYGQPLFVPVPQAATPAPGGAPATPAPGP